LLSAGSRLPPALRRRRSRRKRLSRFGWRSPRLRCCCSSARSFFTGCRSDGRRVLR